MQRDAVSDAFFWRNKDIFHFILISWLSVLFKEHININNYSECT